MRGLTISAHGGLDRLELRDDLPEPSLRTETDVRVRVRAAALNHLDLFVVGGLPNVHITPPWIIGSDAMGTIESMSYCSWDSLGVVKAGDTLDLESVYDSAEAIPDAMGIMVMHVWQTDDLSSGTPAPAEANGGVAPAAAGNKPAGGSHHGSQGGHSGPH